MDEGRPLRVDFVGVGVIATAIVDSLMSGPHAGEIDVVLSHPDRRLEAPNLRRGTRQVAGSSISWRVAARS